MNKFIGALNHTQYSKIIISYFYTLNPYSKYYEQLQVPCNTF